MGMEDRTINKVVSANRSLEVTVKLDLMHARLLQKIVGCTQWADYGLYKDLAGLLDGNPFDARPLKMRWVVSEIDQDLIESKIAEPLR